MRATSSDSEATCLWRASLSKSQYPLMRATSSDDVAAACPVHPPTGLNTLSCGQPLRTRQRQRRCSPSPCVSIPSHAGNLFGRKVDGNGVPFYESLNTLSCGQPLRTASRPALSHTELSLNTLSCGQPLRTLSTPKGRICKITSQYPLMRATSSDSR